MYSQNYLGHFQNPRNIGELEDADGIGEVKHEGGGCFDWVKVYIRTDGDRISLVKYKTRGCSGTIAACSLMSELATGLVLSELDSLNDKRLIDELNLPERKFHSAELAVKALRNAVEKVKR
ncbi:iron-sulfur cluster assembly scaffold protein [candidate division KSB1 bacterium]|nr:iron-sulfur cluster assembly scaffold protein [candidate division KSB1 bacterium]